MGLGACGGRADVETLLLLPVALVDGDVRNLGHIAEFLRILNGLSKVVGVVLLRLQSWERLGTHAVHVLLRIVPVCIDIVVAFPGVVRHSSVKDLCRGDVCLTTRSRHLLGKNIGVVESVVRCVTVPIMLANHLGRSVLTPELFLFVSSKLVSVLGVTLQRVRRTDWYSSNREIWKVRLGEFKTLVAVLSAQRIVAVVDATINLIVSEAVSLSDNRLSEFRLVNAVLVSVAVAMGALLLILVGAVLVVAVIIHRFCVDFLGTSVMSVRSVGVSVLVSLHIFPRLSSLGGLSLTLAATRRLLLLSRLFVLGDDSLGDKV